VLARGEFAGLGGTAALGLPIEPGRWDGAVTPGITSIGLTGAGEEGLAGLGAAETAPADGCADFGVSGVLALGRSGSEAGASNGGGSWAMARLVPQTKTKNDRPRSARNIGLVSRIKDDLRTAMRLPWYHRSAPARKIRFFRTSPYLRVDQDNRVLDSRIRSAPV